MITYCQLGPRRYDLFPVQPYVRQCWEIQVALSGKLIPVYESGPQSSEQNAWLFSPRSLHGWLTLPHQEAHIAVVHFESVPPLIEAFFQERSNMAFMLSDSTLTEIQAITEQILHCIGRAEALNVLKYQKFQAECLLLLFQNSTFSHQMQRTSPRQTAEKGLAWLQANLEQSPQLEDLAQYLCISMTQLRRVFHGGLGKSPMEALGELKMQRACELLRDTDLGVEQIALACGYSNASNLTRIFSQKKGISPGQWRKSFNRSDYGIRLEKQSNPATR